MKKASFFSFSITTPAGYLVEIGIAKWTSVCCHGRNTIMSAQALGNSPVRFKFKKNNRTSSGKSKDLVFLILANINCT